ncbi:MAG: heavy-metal-associated domain-containing protein [Gammaproteobacteria bacterium]|nr:heavy-metal-associated domain-containing protein [Gammaproteobacteria bacterium]
MSQNIRLSIPGMKCNGCVSAIEKALSDDIGVTSATVELETKTASIETDTELPVLLAALKNAGFEATEMAADHRDASA